MPQTLQQLLRSSREKIDLLDAELIIAHELNKPREFVIAHPEMKITSPKIGRILKSIKLREKNMPLAYLTGHKEFFGLDFIVNKNVLIPRSDTELMVENVIEKIKTQDSRLQTILIDIGTGSGCIPIAITKSLNHYITTSPKIYAIDISKRALTVAKKNAKLHKVKIKFLQGDLLSPVLKSSFFNPKSSIIITANLPYLTKKQFSSEPSIQHEPKLALVAGKDGLEYYKKLLPQIKLLTPYVLSLTAFFEIDPAQTTQIKLLIKKYLPQAKIKIKTDLGGKDRLVIIENKN